MAKLFWTPQAILGLECNFGFYFYFLMQVLTGKQNPWQRQLQSCGSQVGVWVFSDHLVSLNGLTQQSPHSQPLSPTRLSHKAGGNLGNKGEKPIGKTPLFSCYQLCTCINPWRMLNFLLPDNQCANQIHNWHKIPLANKPQFRSGCLLHVCFSDQNPVPCPSHCVWVCSLCTCGIPGCCRWFHQASMSPQGLHKKWKENPRRIPDL